VTQLANAFEENNINVNKITGACIAISSWTIRRKFAASRGWLKRRPEIRPAVRLQGLAKARSRCGSQSRPKLPDHFIVGLSSAYRQGRERAFSSLENRLVICAVAILAGRIHHTVEVDEENGVGSSFPLSAPERGLGG
jgi:hypothetical protein